MATRERVLRYLRDHPEGASDDEVARVLGLKRRQQANALCRALAAEGAIRRETVEGKVHNLPSEVLTPIATDDDAAPAPIGGGGRYDRSWAWEGNVREAVARYLAADSYAIEQPESPGAGEPAASIDARAGDGQRLLVAVRGLPPESTRNRALRVRQEFAAALLDAVLWRGRDERPQVAIAVPEFISYRQLVSAAEWAFPAIQLTILWVKAGGEVRPARYGDVGPG